MSTDPTDRCLFCAVATGDVPAHTVFEDEHTLAFLDINPAADGHTLVIPKAHADDLLDVDADTASTVMRSVRTVARIIDRALAPDGLTVMQANRRAGWQDVFHLHVHVVPRHDGDALTPPWTPQSVEPESLSAVATRLRGMA
ncbi:HIT family protein [Nocardioides sp. Soil805]|uniref:HIT family protein n=1 Tax=Nocardioides sp. Soil805 TaxID=1736416 RepID=UPI000702E039|nr:HIT family protein [Nocardioides sp. Soil805]KRF34635.1 hypothetical protein ASG94_10655 [Nocardioides sp. Soil805]